jgi:hypothetical protein
MMTATRFVQKYAKHLKNQLKHLERPLNQWHVRKCDRPRCGVPCGHPLHPKRCRAPVVAGRHPKTGAPILGKHCRKHGGWA